MGILIYFQMVSLLIACQKLVMAIGKDPFQAKILGIPVVRVKY